MWDRSKSQQSGAETAGPAGAAGASAALVSGLGQQQLGRAIPSKLQRQLAKLVPPTAKSSTGSRTATLTIRLIKATMGPD
jgi:hypothetical protein